MILITIYPEYVKKIKEGLKKYEFRKIFSKRRKNRITKQGYVIIYESMPESTISMILKIERIYEDNLSNLWRRFGSQSGITKDYFLNYYYGKNRGVAIEIKDFLVLKKPITLLQIKQLYPNFIPPQNFYELSNEKYPLLYQRLKKKISKNKF